MAGLTEHPTKWSDVDLEHALPSDPRPWAALVSALAERCAAVGRALPSGVCGVYYPSVAACEAVRAEIAALCRGSYVTLDAPRVSGLGWNYAADAWSSFPQNVWPSGFYKPDDALYPVYPPFPDSGRPMHEPALLMPEGHDDNEIYRSFLADCAFWLDRCRYVDASALAVRESCRDGAGSWSASLSASLAGMSPSANPARGVNRIAAEYSNDGAGAELWRVAAGPYELYAVNPSPLPAVARLVLGFSRGGRTYESRTTVRNVPGAAFVATAGNKYAEAAVWEERAEYRHSGVWVAEMVETHDASGVVPKRNAQGDIVDRDPSNATETRTHIVRRWDETGLRSFLIEDYSWTRHLSGGSVQPDADSAARDSYSLFDPFGLGEGAGPAVSSVEVPAHGRALLADLAAAFEPAASIGDLMPPEADYRTLFVRFACSPSVVLDYHDAFKFKLAEEESE